MRPARGSIYALIGVLVFLVVLVAGSVPALASPYFYTPVDSSSGSHIDNAIALSSGSFPNGAPAAVVTNVDDPGQSLTAAVLARACDGPLLLAGSSTLAANVGAELSRLQPSVVYVVGLPATVANQIVATLQSLPAPPQVVTLTGANGYDTSVLVARQLKVELGTTPRVLIARGDSHATAIAGSALAAAEGWPILLTPGNGALQPMVENVIVEIGATSGVVVGTSGTYVTSGNANFTIAASLLGTPTPGDPDGRYDTAAQVAEYAKAEGLSSFYHVGLAAGDEFPDCEILAAHVARDDGILLFSTDTGLPSATAAVMQAHGSEISYVDFVGVGWPVYRQVKSLNSPRVTALGPSSGPVAGGSSLVVIGSAFDGATSVTVGKTTVPSSNWRIDSSSQITILSTPQAFGAGPVEVVVRNYWGRNPAAVTSVYTYDDGGPELPGDKVVQEALKYVGVPYLWAGASPSAGFDCSGLVMYVYGKLGVTLPHYSASQANYGTPVNSQADLLPGDLVFFYNPIHHVGIYVGGGMMINAPRSGDLVTIENAFRTNYVGARRIFSAHTRFEQADPRLTYEGSWVNCTVSSASGGSYLYLNSPGSVTLRFTGASLAWIAKTSPIYGQAEVTLDGGTPVPVDLYSASTLFQRTVYSTGTLDWGNHTLTIKWAGAKNASASGYLVDIDALDVVGSLTGSSGPVCFQETDSHLTYAGSWYNATAGSASGGSYRYANSAGSSVKISFTGTGLALFAKKSPAYGQAKLTLDGGTPAYVDLYSSSVLYQQNVFGTGELEDKEHTLVIEWAGAKNASSSGYLITLDSIYVAGSLNQSPAAPGGPAAVTGYQQTDSRLAYTGSWYDATATSASGGSYRYANSAGSSVKISFTGTGLALFAKKSPAYGQAKMTLDGGTPAYVDLYSPSVLYQQNVFGTGDLASGDHTLVIEWAGTKNSSSSGYLITLDAIYVAGTLNQASGSSSGGVTCYEQTDSRLAYWGSWYNAAQSSASGGSYHYANSPGAAVTVSFTGTGLALFAKKSPAYGQAKVTLDGGTPAYVDLYGSSTLYQQNVYGTGTLENKEHTLTIEWAGAKCSSSSGYLVTLDAIYVAGTLTQAPGPTRYEQTDPNLAYAGSWISNPSASSASGGSFSYAGSSNSSVTVSFNGTHLAWIAAKSPVYGQAKVVLDEGAPVTVDLYSASESWRESVYSTGLLAAGVHTVTIQWTWGRNTAAVDRYVGVDAFDVMGTMQGATATVLQSPSLLVVIDPGHQKYADPSQEPVGPGSTTTKDKVSSGTASVNTHSPESELVLTVGLKLRDALELYGIDVLMTRTTQDVNISNAERAQMANAAGADLFVRVHADGVSDSTVHGILMLYPVSIAGWTDDIAVASLRGATLAQQELIAATGASNRGLSARSDMTGFNWSDVPVFLPEIGLMTNPTEDALLATGPYQDKIVQGLKQAVLTYLGAY